MEIADLLTAIRADPRCKVAPPIGIPSLTAPHVLPEDVRSFYTQAGGVSFFTDSPCELRILAPSEVRAANPVIVGEQFDDDITSSWYLIGSDAQVGHLTIDCDPTRLGRCYDSFPDSHGIRGSCPIIARTFTDLVRQIFAGQGGYWYWLADDFESLGDAYDDDEE